tara:strand:- start:61 stop:363 length:303 start_codon:yes stop_codon:yes gene_type:complete
MRFNREQQNTTAEQMIEQNTTIDAIQADDYLRDCRAAMERVTETVVTSEYWIANEWNLLNLTNCEEEVAFALVSYDNKRADLVLPDRVIEAFPFKKLPNS